MALISSTGVSAPKVTTMNNYVIHTDSACDIKPELLEKWRVSCTPLTFRFTDSETEYSNDGMQVSEFYQQMREGKIAKTSAINVDTFRNTFEAILKEGKDILYLGFSSGLSTTYHSAELAAEELAAEYPDRRIVTVDTLAASAGFGLLVYLTVEQQKKGASLEEAAAYVKETVPHLCHWFTVDDLVYLKRGGRISPTVAFFGNVLGIKPVLHVDDEGHLVNVTKVRSRKTSIATLADKYGELARQEGKNPVYISHSDCQKDAEELRDILKSRYKVKVELITDVGPVIGAHSGPGTLALFFVGTER